MSPIWWQCRAGSRADDGQRFLAKPLPPLAVSKHRKFRPIDIKMGPDGAIYVADLYQQLIQHNQIDFRDPRRDHSRGRIWRIVAKGRPLLTPPRLTGVPVAAVIEQLRADGSCRDVYHLSPGRSILIGREQGDWLFP